jgi:glucan phosphoethanolaminetransferase (alkaline phosphatase superfamily)
MSAGAAWQRIKRSVRCAQSYDNAVLYDDAVVDAIIRRFENRRMPS